MKEEFISAFTKYHSLNGATHLAHWNITGMFFFQLHGLFERIYTILDAHEDGFAEQARGCGIEIPAKVFNDVPEIDWESPRDLLTSLLGLTMGYKEGLDNLHKECEDKGNLGFINLIEGFLTDINTIQYLVRSTLDDL